MDFIIITLICIILILILIIVRKKETIKSLKVLDAVNFNAKVALRNKITEEKTKYNELIEKTKTIQLKHRANLLLLLNSNVKVYTQSNFYPNHSSFNGRYYAKINNKEKNNKAEGIPVIDVPNNKNAVLNLYDLRYLLKNNETLDIDVAIQTSTILKEVLIGELGNKALKPYKR